MSFLQPGSGVLESLTNAEELSASHVLNKLFSKNFNYVGRGSITISSALMLSIFFSNSYYIDNSTKYNVLFFSDSFEMPTQHAQVHTDFGSLVVINIQASVEPRCTYQIILTKINSRLNHHGVISIP